MIIQPNMRPGDYMTYRVVCPKVSHFGPATCEDVECVNYLNGWASMIDEGSELGRKQAHYIRSSSGRSFTESRTPEGLTQFTFRPNQPCFKEHVYRNELPPIFRVQGGDFRGNPLGIRPVTHKRPEDWVEDFALHQDKVKTILERG